MKSIGYVALPPSRINRWTEYSYPSVVNLDNQKLLYKLLKSLPLQVGISLQSNIKLKKLAMFNFYFKSLSSKINPNKKM